MKKAIKGASNKAKSSAKSKASGAVEGAKNKAVSKLNELGAGLFNFPQIDSDLSVWFIFGGKEYELSQFSIGFGQSVDHKGQPQDEVRGGRILLTLTEAVPENLYQWAMTSRTENGEIVFKSNTANSPLRVEFMNAYCVGFDRVVGSGGVKTAMTISPEEIMINGISFDNRWIR